MAVRKPLFVSSGNLQEMTTAMVDEIVDGIDASLEAIEQQLPRS